LAKKDRAAIPAGRGGQSSGQGRKGGVCFVGERLQPKGKAASSASKVWWGKLEGKGKNLVGRKGNLENVARAGKT